MLWYFGSRWKRVAVAENDFKECFFRVANCCFYTNFTDLYLSYKDHIYIFGPRLNKFQTRKVLPFLVSGASFNTKLFSSSWEKRVAVAENDFWRMFFQSKKLLLFYNFNRFIPILYGPHLIFGPRPNEFQIWQVFPFLVFDTIFNTILFFRVLSSKNTFNNHTAAVMLQTIPNFEAKIQKGVYFTLFCAKSCFFVS